MINKQNVRSELEELQSQELIINFLLTDKEICITILENDNIVLETNYMTYYKFKDYIINDKTKEQPEFNSKITSKTFESFEEILSAFSPLYTKKFNELLFNKLAKLQEEQSNNDYNDNYNKDNNSKDISNI